MTSLIPPQPPTKFDHNASEITAFTDETLNKVRTIRDQVAHLAPEECNFNSVFLQLAQAETFLDDLEPIIFYHHVAADADVRKASNDAENKLCEFSVEQEMRMDLFNAKKAAELNITANVVKLEGEDKRLVDKMMLEGRRSGLNLPEEKREELESLKKELSQLCNEFSNNNDEESGTISFTLEELEGVPADIISGYPKRTEDGVELYSVTHKNPDISPILRSAVNPDTRRRTHESSENKTAINVPILTRILDLRKHISALLGYETWADYVIETQMAKNSRNVYEFLDELEKKLRPVGEQDLKNLLQLKEAEHKERGLPFDGALYRWDSSYYERLFVQKNLSLDGDKIREYFPVPVVVPVIMSIYQNLLSLRFEKVENPSVWHPDVQQYSVWEHSSTDDSGFVGYFYLDIFPRENKYSHAAVWPLTCGYDIFENDGKTTRRSYPIAAMVANLAKETPETPALMRHFDVVTFFHEMGHVFHHLLSKTKYCRFHGTKGPEDWVEAPSQMLENWCWEPSVLKKMTSHYKTQETLPSDMIEKLVQSRYQNIGLFYLNQVFYAKYDLRLHTDKEKTDHTKLWSELRTSITHVKAGEGYGPGQTGFGHLAGGYDSRYYGYSYSLVFASDMYQTIFKKDPLNPALGELYKQKILLPGASRDEIDLLKDFLGREPKADAFQTALFGSTSKEA